LRGSRPRVERPHGDHQLAAEAAGGRGVEARAVHRHVLALLHVAQAQARLEQRLLEGKRAAEDEGDQVLAPERADVADVLHRLAVAEYAVARHVGADVEVFAERGQLRLPGLRSGEEGAGLGIALAKERKLLAYSRGRMQTLACT